jgi:hypothetical protein
MHLGSPAQRRRILADLGRKKPSWLLKAAGRMVEVVTRDWRKWGKAVRED